MKPLAALNPLTASERRLVHDNLGLVAVHLRKHHPHERGLPDGEDRWDELFQDGCLGLILAARSFDPDRGVPFAVHAWPRIRSAVSDSMRHRGMRIHSPARRPRPSKDDAPGSSPPRKSDPFKSSDTAPRLVPRLFTRSPDELDGLPSRASGPGARCAGAVGDGPHESLGDWLADKLRAAAAEALIRTCGKSETRQKREALVRRIIEDRVMVPESQARPTPRDIARETGSSYGWVVDCEAQVTSVVSRLLAGEDEFRLLRELSSRLPGGLSEPAEGEVLGKLLAAGVDQAVRQFSSTSRVRQAGLVLEVLEKSGFDLLELIRRHVTALSPGERTAWLAAQSRP